MDSPTRELHVVTTGEGPPVLFVHGSATDHTTWGLQVRDLSSSIRLITYDRRGTGLSPLSPGAEPPRVEDHAADAAALIERVTGGRPLVACGSSFGAVVVLELARQRPDLLLGAMLLEPPIPSRDDLPSLPPGFVAWFDERLASEGGPAAAELFLRMVLGDEAYERIPRPIQERSKALHAAIRRDIAALQVYTPRYVSLRWVHTPVLLLGGERSAPIYAPTLAALHGALGRARLEKLAGAGHLMHAEVHRRFNERLLSFLGEVPLG